MPPDRRARTLYNSNERTSISVLLNLQMRTIWWGGGGGGGGHILVESKGRKRKEGGKGSVDLM